MLSIHDIVSLTLHGIQPIELFPTKDAKGDSQQLSLVRLLANEILALQSIELQSKFLLW